MTGHHYTPHGEIYLAPKRQFAFVRQLQKGSGANLKTVADIRSAEKHAKRKDNTSQMRQRDDANVEGNYFWSRCGDSFDNGGADYFDAFKAHKAHHGVTSERKGAALASHALVGVSPEWLAETGSPHDLENPRVKELINKAKDWAESWMGEGAVWAVRYDTDEIGSGIVDVIASPIRIAKHKSGSSKPSISINKAQKELVDLVNTRRKAEWVEAGNAAVDFKPIQKSFRGMQDSWAWFAQEHLDPKLERGDPKEQTRREHLFPEEFKEALKAAAEFEGFEAKAEEMAQELAQMQAQAEAAAEQADLKCKEMEERARRAKQLEDEAIAKTTELRQERSNILEAIKSAKTKLSEMVQKRSILYAEIASATNDLRTLRQQADSILDHAKAEAASIVLVAKEQTARIVQEVVAAWPEFKDVPQPFKQAMNHYTGLVETIRELFTKTDFRDLPTYSDQVQPEERTEAGDPPPALDLVMSRAKKRIEAKNDLASAPSPRGPAP